MYRLALDLGSNSLGWCALVLDEEGRPTGVLDGGVRVFREGRDPQSKQSNAVARREARAMRRRRDRFKRRQAALLRRMTELGLFPADAAERAQLQRCDPYALRARALDEKLTLHEIGRAIFHLNQRRGFKSNRKTDRGAEDEAGKIAVGIDRLRAAMAETGARTLGEFLHRRRAAATNANAVPSVRTRLRPETGEGAKGDGYDFYPGRALVEDEFDAIWEAQSLLHGEALTPEMHDALFEIVFHQRPLAKPRIGKCMLIPTDARLPKAHPLFQRRRLLEELNALEIVTVGAPPRKLSKTERDLLLSALKGRRKMSFEAMRKALKLDPEARFNKERDNRTELLGDEVAAEMGAKTRFGKAWAHLSPEAQWEAIARLEAVESDGDAEAFRGWLMQAHALPEENAAAILKARLPVGYGRLGLEATRRLVAALEAEVIVYSEAVGAAGLGDHSNFHAGAAFEELPYYGLALERYVMPGTGDPGDPEEMRVGRLSNPTVHIGLNQVRKVVNAAIRRYGKPAEIVIELARELKLSDEEATRLDRENKRNRERAERHNALLRSIGWPESGANRLRLRLWEELNPDNVLDRRCVYTGRQISQAMLFTEAVEVDHILPLTETLDDSFANKVLCLREANRDKRKRAPHEAFSYRSDWPEIAERAARLPANKRWRFGPDAMDRFREEGGFEARQLVDTQYLGRLAREYLAGLYPSGEEALRRVWVSPGRLTELVRRKLGLNDLLPDHNIAGSEQPKNRRDHRHHLIDAAVVGIVDRAMLKRISDASRQDGSEGRERIVIPEPWAGFRDDLEAVVERTVVAHKPDHGTFSKAGLPRGRDATAGRLHNDTAYGPTREKDTRGNALVVRRVPVTSLKKTEDIEKVRAPNLRAALLAATEGRTGKDFEQALRAFVGGLEGAFKGLRRVRLIEPLAVIPISDRSGRIYKGYKGDSNARFDVWELKDGRWEAEVVSTFAAHQPGWTSEVRAKNPTARKVLSLRQDDIVAIEQHGERRLMRVVKFRQSGQITLADHNEAGPLKERDALPNEIDPFKYVSASASGLMKMKARQVRVDLLGRVQDPGFPARKAVRATRRKAAE